MVLMNGSKRARNAASLVNRTNVYGIIGGTVSTVGVTQYTRPSLSRAGVLCNCIPTSSPAAGLAYMTSRRLLSVNPVGSGGVGRRSLLINY